MFDAAVAGDLGLVQYHVKAGVDINYAHPEFLSTPLVAAILARQDAVARYLLESGADPRLPSEFDAMTPMQAARHVGSAGLEAELLARGAAPLPAPPPPKKGWFARWFGRDPA